MEKEHTVFTLDNDKDYLLVESLKLEENEYLYLIEVTNPKNFMFATIKENKIIKVTDEVQIGKLFLLFDKKIKNNN